MMVRKLMRAVGWMTSRQVPVASHQLLHSHLRQHLVSSICLIFFDFFFFCRWQLRSIAGQRAQRQR